MEEDKEKSILELMNEMKKKYKIALFMVIRDQIQEDVNRLKLKYSKQEISRKAYELMGIVLLGINFKEAEKFYEKAKRDFEDKE